MSPLELIHPYLHELMFQHFSGAEILHNVSLVSPDWCEITGKSKTCMNKVKFLYQVWRHQFHSSTEVFQCAMKSWRMFQHVIVELGVNDDLKGFWKFIESCSDSLISLKIENVRRFGELNLKFPNLEILRAYSIDEKSLLTLLKSTEKLTELFISSGESSLDQIFIDNLIVCLKRNKNLVDLYLKNTHFLRIFEENLSVNFQLKSLKLLNTSARNEVSPELEKNLLHFIDEQKSRLETFFFEFSSDQIVEKAFNLPAVASLGFLKVPSANLKKNFNIKSLEIPFDEDFASVRKIVDASPNIERLFVATVTNELIDFLSWNFMKLTSLNFKMISLDSEEYYEKLKQDHPEVNQLIDIWDYENVDWE